MQAHARSIDPILVLLERRCACGALLVCAGKHVLADLRDNHLRGNEAEDDILKLMPKGAVGLEPVAKGAQTGRSDVVGRLEEEGCDLARVEVVLVDDAAAEEVRLERKHVDGASELHRERERERPVVALAPGIDGAEGQTLVSRCARRVDHATTHGCGADAGDDGRGDGREGLDVDIDASLVARQVEVVPLHQRADCGRNPSIVDQQSDIEFFHGGLECCDDLPRGGSVEIEAERLHSDVLVEALAGLRCALKNVLRKRNKQQVEALLRKDLGVREAKTVRAAGDNSPGARTRLGLVALNKIMAGREHSVAPRSDAVCGAREEECARVREQCGGIQGQRECHAVN
eukprot:m.132090 g.132090  ORF g.132090 m.132090 type:complete len:345 (-) comp9482_c0_seq1:26-1060(-)